MRIRIYHSTLQKIDLGTAIAMLMFFVGLLSIKRPLGSDLGAEVYANGPLAKAIGYVAYLAIPMLIAVRWKRFLYVITQDLPLLCLNLLVPISILWSIDPSSTSGGIRGVIRATLFGVYLATRFSLKDQLRLLTWLLVIAAGLSFVFAVVVPGYGIHPGISKHAGLWTGIYPHKNLLGRMMTLCALSTLTLVLSGNEPSRLRRLFLWIGFALALFLLIQSSSTGALFALAIASCVYPIAIVIKRRHYRIQAVLLSLGTLLGLGSIGVLAISVVPLLGTVGKDITLTGRIPLWGIVMNFISERPWLGYGHRAFWSADSGGELLRYMHFWDSVPDAHNGFLEILLDVGIVGFVCLVLSVVPALWRATTKVIERRSLEDLLPLQLLVACLATNMAESSLLKSDDIFWVLYVSIALSLALESRRARRLSERKTSPQQLLLPASSAGSLVDTTEPISPLP